MLHKDDFTLSAPCRICPEYAIILIMDSGLHRIAGSLDNEHITVKFPHSVSSHPSGSIHFFTIPEIAACRFHGENREEVDIFHVIVYLRFYSDYIRLHFRWLQLCGKMSGKCFIAKVYVTAFHATCHECPVCVLDNLIRNLQCRIAVFFQFFLYAFYGLVITGAFEHISHDMSVLESHIGAYNDTDIIQLKPLACMYTPYFLDRIFPYQPRLFACLQIPFFPESEFRYYYVEFVRIILAFPVPAVTCDNTGFVVGKSSLRPSGIPAAWWG